MGSRGPFQQPALPDSDTWAIQLMFQLRATFALAVMFPAFFTVFGCAHGMRYTEMLDPMTFYVDGEVAVSSEQEPCYNTGMYEICVNLAEVEKIVNPREFRQAFLAQIVEQQRNRFLATRTLVTDTETAELKARWNKIVAGVLGYPRGRTEFYDWVLCQPSGSLVAYRLELPLMRVSGLPRSPRLRFEAENLAVVMSSVEFMNKDTAVLPDRRLLIEKFNTINAEMEKEDENGFGRQFGHIFNAVPLLVELAYQLRQLYVQIEKEVFLFEDTPDHRSPSCDLAGNLYLPAGFFTALDPSDRELVLLHEAAHLAFPPPFLLAALGDLSSTLGPAGTHFGQNQLIKGFRHVGAERETEVDALVVRLLKLQPALRKRYQTLIRRLDKGKARAQLIGYLNNSIEAGEWPRPAVRLPPDQLIRLIEAYVRFDNKDAPPDERMSGFFEFCKLNVNALPESDQPFYRGLFPILIDHILERQDTMLAGYQAQYTISEREFMQEAFGTIFEEVKRQWQATTQ